MPRTALDIVENRLGRGEDTCAPNGCYPRPQSARQSPPVEAAVLNSLAHVLRLEVCRPLEVGDGAGDLENLIGQRAVLHGRHLEVDVDAIEQGPRDAGEVARDAEGPADAIVLRIAEIAAGTSPRCLFAVCG